MADKDWDLEAVYDTQIHPLMEQIISICKEHEMPMLASFQYAKNGDDADFCTIRIRYDGESKRFHLATQVIREGLFAAAVRASE